MAHNTNQPPHPHAEHHGVGHIVSPKILIATGAALLVLTAVTVFVANIDFEVFDLKELNIFVALGIAVIKASLVCLFFMHLRWDRPFNAFVLIASLSFVALFIGFALTDTSEYQPEVIQGNTKDIQTALEELKQPAEPASHEPAPHEPTPAASH